MGNIIGWFGWSMAGSGLLSDIAVLVVKTSLLMLATLLVQWLLHRRSPALRHLVLRSGLIGLLMLTAMWIVLPSWQLPLPGIMDRAWTATASIFQFQGTAIASQSSVPNSPSWASFLVIGWLIGSLIVMVRFAFGLYWINRIVKKATPVKTPDLISTAASIKADLGIRSHVWCICSDRVHVPMVWGVFRPVVILPHQYTDWTNDERDMILRHELAHIKRRDVLWLNLASLLTVIHWFNPAAWLMKQRLNKESEYACDDHVLAFGIGSRDYAQHLLQTARMVNHSYAGANPGIAFIQNKGLEGRIMSILAKRKKLTAIPGTIGVAITAITVLTALLLGGLSLQSCGDDNAGQEKNESMIAPTEETIPSPHEWIAVDRAPEMIHEQAPEYPAEATEKGIEGKVTIQAYIDKTGTVIKAMVKSSSGNELLDAAALDAAWKNRYTPAKQDGLPCGIWIEYKVNFTEKGK
jgi:TonB family protein